MSNKEEYRYFCEIEKKIPLFSQAWWLDLVCGNEWDVCVVKKGREIVASMPYVKKKSYGLTLLTQPRLTQILGPWTKPSTAKYSKALGQQKNMLIDLVEQLPKYDYFSQNWHYSQKNWLPFYWKGFEQTTRYTYVVDDLTNIDSVWSNFQENIRREIRKAENLKLTVKTDLPISDFISLNSKTFSRQDMSVPYSESFIKKIAETALARQQCKWFIAQDESGLNHAGVFIVWDENSAYYLMGGGDPHLRKSGATSLCMWEAIKFSSSVTQKFDFEGSMIQPIERFFRGFGAVQKQYYTISKTNSKMIKVVLFLRAIFKR